MIIKEISTQHKGLYIIKDTKEAFKKYYSTPFNNDYKKFLKWYLEYFKINKKYNLIDYEIIENERSKTKC